MWKTDKEICDSGSHNLKCPNLASFTIMRNGNENMACFGIPDSAYLLQWQVIA